MLTTMFSNDNHELNRYMVHIMNRINYDNLYRGIAISKAHPYNKRKIVLMKYINSSTSSNILEIERFPNSSMSIHNFINSDEGMRNLSMLFVTGSHMKLYTRRHFAPYDDDDGTKCRQLILEIEPTELPPSVSNESTIYCNEPCHCIQGVERLLD